MRIMWLPITYQWALKKCNYREFWCAVVYTQTSFSRVFNDNLTLLWLYNHHELVKSFQFYHCCRQVKGKLVECFTKKRKKHEMKFQILSMKQYFFLYYYFPQKRRWSHPRKAVVQKFIAKAWVEIFVDFLLNVKWKQWNIGPVPPYNYNYSELSYT